MPRQKTIAHPPADTMERQAERAGATVVVPFPGRTARPARPTPESGEARGQILLFLGVRYERLAS